MGLGALASVGGVALSRLTLVVSRELTVGATVPALESRMGAATGAFALAVSGDPVVLGLSFPSLARQASVPSTMRPMYVL